MSHEDLPAIVQVTEPSAADRLQELHEGNNEGLWRFGEEQCAVRGSQMALDVWLIG